jgi:hypothetical protein
MFPLVAHLRAKITFAGGAGFLIIKDHGKKPIGSFPVCKAEKCYKYI